MKKVLCPECLRSVEYSLESRNDTHVIRGEEITVPAEVAVCAECGAEMGLAEIDDAVYLAAFDEYRKRHGLMFPDDIRALRERYGLGQKAFARLMGWGDVTVARYESGSLQSDSHESALRLAFDPANVQRLLKINGARLTLSQRAAVEQRLSEVLGSAVLIAQEDRGTYNSETGVRKLGEMFVFFAQEPKMWRTKLNKLSFYADFLHAKRHGVSISGARYAHAPFGPVPDAFYEVQATLASSHSLEERELSSGDCVGTVFAALRQPDMSQFSEEEIATLFDVSGHFRGWSASRIMRFSHQEPLWLGTADGEELRLDQAQTLGLE